MKLTFKKIILLYEKYLKSKAFSIHTIKDYIRELKCFSQWYRGETKQEDIREVTGKDLVHYQQYLFNKEGCNRETQIIYFCRLRNLFAFLIRYEYILMNPFDGIPSPKKGAASEREVLSVDEMNKFLDGINGRFKRDIRDRCMFELMYGTGLRVGEVSALNITDIDIKGGVLAVRKGKGKKERLIPLGKNVCSWLKIYLSKGRQQFMKRAKGYENSNAIFLSLQGIRMRCGTIAKIIKNRLKQLGMRTKGISAHVIRHSFATHMLENGVDIKYIKDILGHSHLETTVIYTHMTINNLKRTMKMYHPRENELYEEIKFSKKWILSLPKK
jgi:integrase/recombinase XerD